MPLAIVLAKSIEQNDPNARVLMCVVEEDLSYASQYLKYFDHVILAKELGFSNFYFHMFKHNAYEASGSCKAKLMQYALNTFKNEDKFIFLDSDTKVFGPFDEISEELNQHNIILTSHILEPGIRENIFYKFGIFNTGLFAIKRSEESTLFLRWWADRAEKACFNDPGNGLFLEQKWLNHAPVYFNIDILRHPGYNVGWWNLHHRKIELSKDGKFTVNGQPLKLFHFSSIIKFWCNYIGFLNEKSKGNYNPLLSTLVNQYVSELSKAGTDFPKIIPWSYDYFASGKPIKMAARLALRKSPKSFSKIKNPFLKSNNTFIKRKTKKAR
jgi:hypothetical protein